MNKEKIKNEVALMFSGGIDSLLSAVILQEQFDKVHLLTFNKGYLEFGLKNNRKNILKLKKVYGSNKFIANIISIKEIIHNVSTKKFFKDIHQYGGEISWCVGCRLSMNIGALIYALENNLLAIADGSNKEQVPGNNNLVATAENYPKVIQQLKDFADGYNVKFITPVFEFGSREKKRKKLMKLGMEIDYLSKDHSKKITGIITKDIFYRAQPICFSGWIIHWKRNLLGIPVKHDEVKTVEYIQNKQKQVIQNYIKNYFSKRNIDIDEIIKKRKMYLQP